MPRNFSMASRSGISDGGACTLETLRCRVYRKSAIFTRASPNSSRLQITNAAEVPATAPLICSHLPILLQFKHRMSAGAAGKPLGQGRACARIGVLSLQCHADASMAVQHDCRAGGFVICVIGPYCAPFPRGPG